jgi:hypothetical protein
MVYGYRGIGAEITLDVPPMIISGRTMVPTRFVAESMGATVNWIADTNTVEIISAADTVTPPSDPVVQNPVEALPNLDFELQTAEYQENNFVAEGTFTNTGNVKITQVDKVSIRIYLQNADGDQVLLTDGDFENIPVNLEPGQSDVYSFIFRDVTVYEDAVSFSSEEYDWLYTYEE